MDKKPKGGWNFNLNRGAKPRLKAQHQKYVQKNICIFAIYSNIGLNSYCCQISFPIGKEMFYFDSSNAIRKTIRKQKTFILLRRIPLCDTFGCYCKTEIYIWNIWRKHFCKTLPFHLLVADCSIFTLSSLVAIAVHFLVRTPQIMNFANIWRKGHFFTT